MADGVTLNSGTGGATAATDDCGAAGHTQVVKLAVSADGSATHITADSKGLLVQQTTAADFNCTEASASAIKTAVELLDDVVKTDDAAFTPGTSKVAVVGAEFDDTTPDSVDEGDAGALRMSGRRELYVQIRDAAGNERGLNIDANNAIAVTNAGLTELAAAIDTEVQVDIVGALPAGTNAIGKLAANNGVDIGDVDVTSVVPGTGATNLGKAEDAAHASGDVGVQALAVRTDTPGNRSGTDGDYEPLQMSGGRLWTSATIDAALPAGTNAIGKLAANDGVDIGNVDVASVAGNVTVVQSTASSLKTEPAGQVAHDAADSGNPLKIGAKASTSLAGLTLVANADRTDLFAGIDGALIVRPHCGLEDIVSGNASNTDGSSTQVIAAAGAGIKQYLTSVTVSNTSSTNTYCELKSGTTVMYTLPVPANGGVTHTFNVPLKPNAANEAWNFDMGTGVTTAYCSMVGFKSKV